MTSLADCLAALGYAAVPFAKGPTGHLELTAHVNGRTARRFLDTGAGRTIFDATRAARLGLQGQEESRCAGGLGVVGADLLDVREAMIDYRAARLFLKRQPSGSGAAADRPSPSA